MTRFFLSCCLAACLIPAAGQAAPPPPPLATPSWIHDISLDVTKPPYSAACGSEATSRIQAAIDAASAQGGGGVLVPCSFTVSGLTLRSNVHLNGLGPETSVLTGLPTQNVLTMPDWSENITLRNVGVSGGLNGIYVDTLAYHVVMDDVRFTNPAEAAIRVKGSIERWTVRNVRAEGGRWFYKHDFGLERNENYVDKTLFRNVQATGQAEHAWRIEVQYSHSLTLINPAVSQAGTGALHLAGGFRGTNVFNLGTIGSGRLTPGRADVTVAGTPAAPWVAPQTLNFVGGSFAASLAGADLDVQDSSAKVHLFGTSGWRTRTAGATILVLGSAPTPPLPAIPDVPQTRYDVTQPGFGATCNGGDSTKAVQSAINRAESSEAGIYIPCPISVSSLTLRSNVHFYGRTRRIDLGSRGSALIGTNAKDLLTLPNGTQNVSFRNMSLHGGRNLVVSQRSSSNVTFDGVALSMPLEAAIRTSGTASSWVLNDTHAAGGQWLLRHDSGGLTNLTGVQVNALNQSDYPWLLNASSASSVTLVNPSVHFVGRGAITATGPFATVNVTGIYTEGSGRVEAGKDAVLVNAGSGASPAQVHLLGGMIGGHTSSTRSDLNIASAGRVDLYGPASGATWIRADGPWCTAASPRRSAR